MTDRQHDVVESPLGPITVVAASSALVGLYMDQQRHLPAADTFGPRTPGLLPEVAHQLNEYFTGTRTTFDLPWRTSGTQFQQQVWHALALIPYGQTRTYRELAEHIGAPQAARAVGLANGRNPISIILPCHRVVGSAGALTGYGGGIERKRWLLDLERGTPVLPPDRHPSTVAAAE